jgi:hypothetical protein
VWSDAEGNAAASREAQAETRCPELAQQIYGTHDQVHLAPLRAGEPKAVEDVVHAFGPPVSETADLVREVAAAQREGLLARSAADVVKKDIADQSEREQLSNDEMAALPKLRESSALATLLKRGNSDPRAQALGLFSVMDRMQIGHQLPRRLKIPLASASLSLVFGVAPPAIPEDPNKRFPSGVWLKYLTDVAKAAGHPVPAVDDLYDRHEYAWAGVLQGLADKLRTVLGKLDSRDPLSPYVANSVKVLDLESQAGIASLANRSKAPAPSRPHTSK